MNEMILQMAKAHLQNVADRRDQLLAQRGELTKKIEEIEEFLKRGLQVVSEAAKVEAEKPTQSEDRLLSKNEERSDPDNYKKERR